LAASSAAALSEALPVRPGTVIDRSDVDKFAEALTPAMTYAIARP
jgi:hypothetical protein